MPEAKKARAIGINHVALEVGDIEEALAFYGRLFDFRLRGKSESSAFRRRELKDMMTGGDFTVGGNSSSTNSPS